MSASSASRCRSGRTCPPACVLRSNWTATCIAEPQGELTLDAFCAATGASFGRPVPLDRFVDYGLWVQQQVAPDVDQRLVKELEAGRDGFRLTLDDGAALTARRVVVAAGIELFANRPAAGRQAAVRTGLAHRRAQGPEPLPRVPGAGRGRRPERA